MITQPPAPAPSEINPASGRGRGIAILLLIWIVAASFTAQGLAWGIPALGFAIKPQRLAFVASLAQVFALGIPLLPLALFWHAKRYRAMFRTWLAAVGFLLALAVARLLPPTEGQAIILLQVILASFYLVLVVGRRQSPAALEVTTPSTGSLASVPQAGQAPSAIGEDDNTPTTTGNRPATGAVFLTLTIAIIFALPWVAWGALGSPLDVGLNLALAAMFGLTASRIVGRFRLSISDTGSRRLRREIFTGGIVTGGALLIMSSGLSFNGVQLVLMAALPALGWTAMSITTLNRSRTPAGNFAPLALLISLCAVAPLLFTDPDGIQAQALDPILQWALLAALASAGIAWLSGLLMVRAAQRPEGYQPGQRWAVLVVVLAILEGAVYLTGGQTGFHGDRLFVILQDQADVSAASGIQDYNARRRYVYDTLVGHADATQAGFRSALDRLGVGYTPYYLVNGLEVRGGSVLRLWLASRPEVDRVLPSPVLRPPQASPRQARGSADKPEAPQWNLTSIGADRAWREFGVTGKGIVVGQSDSGAQYDHPEIQAGYRGRDGDHNYNWYDPWNGTRAPSDTDGHGTHTLGSILGQTVGVAPGASWFACANLPRNLGNPARYLDCMQFMLAPFPLGGDPFRDGDPLRSAHVLNNSWGCPEDAEGCDPGSLLPAVRALRAAGIFVVVSAGNSGPACGTVTDPIAIYKEALTVGAVDESGDLAEFSSRGPVTVDGSERTKPDIVAPGVEVLSAFPGGTYDRASGTSMAGPHVTGVVALIWSANPNLIGDTDRTEKILIKSARPFTGTLGISLPRSTGGALGNWLMGTGSDPQVCYIAPGRAALPNDLAGYGVVDAYAAVKMALEEK